MLACTQQKQLVSFPRVRIRRNWFRVFNDRKDFRNEGTLHLFSLVSLYSYANFRSNTRNVAGRMYQEGPGEWTCKLSALPRILRAHCKAHALEIMDYFQESGFLTYRITDEEQGVLQFKLAGWHEQCPEEIVQQMPQIPKRKDKV